MTTAPSPHDLLDRLRQEQPVHKFATVPEFKHHMSDRLWNFHRVAIDPLADDETFLRQMEQARIIKVVEP